MPAFMWASDPKAGTTRFDLDEASDLLESAGWRVGSDGIRVKNGERLAMPLAYRSDSLTDRNRGVVLASMLRAAGIDVELKSYATALLYGSYAGGGILATGR